jgi:tape measure domain-containing protein
MGLELAKVFVRVRADSTRLGGDFNKVQSIVKGRVAKLTALIGGAIGGISLFKGVSKAIDLAAEAESTALAFETLAGSVEHARDLLEEIQRFADATPFELKELQDAARQLLIVQTPIEDVMPQLKMLGDISAGSGKNLKELAVIFGQVRGEGILLGGDMRQLTNASIPIRQVLAKNLGVAETEIRKMSSTGKISFQDVVEAFQDMTSEGGVFFDFMGKQSKTFKGRASTLKDAIDGVFRELGQKLLPGVKMATDALISVIEDNKDAIVDFGESIGDFVNNTITWLRILHAEWQTAMELLGTETLLLGSKLADMLENSSALWSSFLGLMTTEFTQWASEVGATFRGLGQALQNVFQTIGNMWAAVWSDSSVMDAFREGMERDARIVAATNAEIAVSRMNHAMRQIDTAVKGAAAAEDLFAPSERTQELEQLKAALADKLGKAFEAASEKEGVVQAGEKIGEEAARKISEMGAGLPFGRFGLAEFGKKAQEAALKGDDKQGKMVGLLEFGNQIQANMLKELQEANQRNNVNQLQPGLLS